MNFIVLGAGAIGCYVGGRLAAHGQPVCLVGRPHALEPIAQHGLKVTDLDGFDRTVPASALQMAPTLADAAPGADSVILLCVKSGATESAARELAAACAPGTPVISLQNGVDNVARIAALAPGLNVLAGMVPYNVVLRGAHVHRATAGHLQLQRDAVTERIAPLFNAAGLATTLPPDIRAVQWGKLLLNLNNPVNALSDLPLRQELLDRDCRRVFAALQTEALRVMARLRNWVVIEKGEVGVGQTGTAKLRLRLDLTQMPKTFQVSALSNKDWNLESEWARWPFVNAEAAPVSSPEDEPAGEEEGQR